MGLAPQETAKIFAKEVEIEDFQASTDCFEKFKLRNEISQEALCGESNEVSAEEVSPARERKQQFANGFKEMTYKYMSSADKQWRI